MVPWHDSVCRHWPLIAAVAVRAVSLVMTCWMREKEVGTRFGFLRVHPLGMRSSFRLQA